MNEMHASKLLIRIETEVQYYSVRPLLHELTRRGIIFDLYIPHASDEHDNTSRIYETTYQLVSKEFTVIRSHSNEKYHIALCANGGVSNKDINCKYLIRYLYAPASSKPDPTYKPDWSRAYHVVFCHSEFEKAVWSVYSRVHVVPYLNYLDYDIRKAKIKNKTVLYLPTWGDASSYEDIIIGLEDLATKGYRVLTKVHHVTARGEKVDPNMQKIIESTHECFGPETPLRDLMAMSDIVVSDNSAAIYEALYANVPVVVFGPETNNKRLGDIDTWHHRWIKEGIIANPKRPEELTQSVERGLNAGYVHKQKKFSDGVFFKDYSQSAVEKWVEILSDYLSDNIPQDYIKMHNLYNKYVDDREDHIIGLQNHISGLELHMKSLEKQIATLNRPAIRRSMALLAKSIKYKFSKSAE